MALAIDIQTQFGTTVSYWKVTRTLINWHEQEAVVSLHGWIDEEARRGGLLPVIEKRYSFGPGDFPFAYERNVVEDAYAATKAMEDFQAAMDC